MASDITTLMVMLWEIQMKILASLDFGFEEAWEYDSKACYLVAQIYTTCWFQVIKIMMKKCPLY
jgi:hypothetical protein